ncbi:ATP-binding protein, partial [Actinocorallia lasiicapitis]
SHADTGRERLLLIEALAQRQGDLLDGSGLESAPEALAVTAELAETFDRAGARLRELDTGLVGREVDLRYLQEIVPACGAVTLVGPGGEGKTALARELAARLSAEYSDHSAFSGVLFVELGPLPADASLDTAAELVRTVLGVERDRDGALPAVLRAVRTRRMLLVLDNAEHLTGGALHVIEEIVRTARTAHAVGGDGSARIVITSRVPLGTPGEQVWRVPTLATTAAVELLYGRPNVVETPVMAELIDALGGLPLAIELAAARLRTLGPEQLAVRLDDRFRVLTGGSRIALPRHQTLRAVIDWSWNLLAADERTVLRRLAIFAGGATLEAAEQVCADGADLLDLLDALADKSLVTVTEDGRYRLLETIRAYGLERLAESGERDRIRAAHAAHFTELIERADPALRAADQLTWLVRLAADHHKLTAALRGGIAAADAI